MAVVATYEDIKTYREQGLTYREIAEIYDANPGTIYRIYKRGEGYKERIHVEPEEPEYNPKAWEIVPYATFIQWLDQILPEGNIRNEVIRDWAIDFYFIGTWTNKPYPKTYLYRSIKRVVSGKCIPRWLHRYYRTRSLDQMIEEGFQI